MEEKEFIQEIKSIEKQVANVVIKSKETFEFVQQGIITAKGMKKKIEEYWREPIRKADDAHKALTAKRAEMLRPVDDFIKRKTRESSDYLTLQDKLRREMQAKEDEERRKKEQAERDKLERAAVRAEDKGNDEKAEELRVKATELFVPPVIVKSEIDKTTRTEAGTISQKKDLEVVVTDEKALIAAIARGEAPAAILNINMAKLKQFIKLNQLLKFDGCEIREIISTQIRAAR